MVDSPTDSPADMPLDHAGKKRTTPSSPYTPASPTSDAVSKDTGVFGHAPYPLS